jgi:uncharacterized protein YciI
MATFLLICIDKPASLALRMATREAHLDYCRANAGIIRLGGPIMNEAGEMGGSMLILEVETIEAAQAFTDNDPYTKANLFQRRNVSPFKVTIGAIA